MVSTQIIGAEDAAPHLKEMLTARQVAKLLNIRIGGVHSAVHQGRLPHTRVGRYSLFRQEDVEAYRRYLANDNAAKAEARALAERFPECPPAVFSLLPSMRHWQVFMAYATTDGSLETVGLEFQVTRERVRQIVTGVTALLTDYAATLENAKEDDDAE